MSDDLNLKASVEVQIKAEIDAALRKIAELNRELGNTSKTGNAAEEGLVNLQKRAQAAGGEFKDLADQLKELNKAQRDFAQGGVAKGSPDGKGVDFARGMSSAELRGQVAVDDANSASFISNARQVLRERENASQNATSTAIASLDKQRQAALSAINKEVAASVAGYQKIGAARTAAYTSAYKAGMASDAAQQAPRYATIPNARRNNAATVTGRASAESEYSKQALSQMRGYYSEQEKSSAAAAKAIGGNATATKTATAATSAHTESMISQRYALYDVATTAGVASVALLGLVSATAVLAAGYESSFTDVERTTLASGAALESIRSQLLGLAREIPLAFGDITSIAALGAQLGIAEGDLAGFTETVAQFSAATNVSIEAAATGFGALGELLEVPAAEYVNLGSAIAQVGVNSVATESEILSVAQQIASYTALAGLSASETVGLSGALASLRVPPEQARSAIQALFTTINKATAEGGDDLQAFASVLGITKDQVTELVQTDPNKFIENLATSLGTLDSQQLTLTLDALGLSEKRVATVLTKLASNTNVLASRSRPLSALFSTPSPTSLRASRIFSPPKPGKFLQASPLVPPRLRADSWPLSRHPHWLSLHCSPSRPP